MRTCDWTEACIHTNGQKGRTESRLSRLHTLP